MGVETIELAMLHDEPAQVLVPGPGWIGEALAAPCERVTCDIDGTDIETLAWGRRGDPGVLLIHGFGAAADWWMFTAPFLARTRRVVALSFSGCGRSGWRDAYSTRVWADEAIGCARASGVLDGGPAAIVAHSFGGSAGAAAAVALGEAVGAFVMIDRPIEQIGKIEREVGEARPPSRFATCAEAIARYRVRPSARDVEPAVMAHIAQAAVRPVANGRDAGWTWRSDPDLRGKLVPERHSIGPELAAMQCARTALRGVHSTLFSPAQADVVRQAGIAVLEVPGADHQLMLDQPIATCVAIDLAIGAGKRA